MEVTGNSSSNSRKLWRDLEPISPKQQGEMLLLPKIMNLNSGPHRENHERRHSRRRHLSGPQALAEIAPGKFFSILNLSQNGMGVHFGSDVHLPPTARFSFSLPDTGRKIEVLGQLTWVDRRGLAGLQFIEINSTSREHLRSWIEEGSDAHPAPPPEAESLSRPKVSFAALMQKIRSLQLDRDSALQLVAEHMMKLTRSTGAAIALESDGLVVCRASSGDAPNVGVVLQPELGLSGECFRTGTIVRCDDTRSDARLDPSIGELLGFRSALMLPIRLGQRSIGVLEVLARGPGHFDNGDVFVLAGLAELVLDLETQGQHRGFRADPAEKRPYSDLGRQETSEMAVQMRTPDGRLICDACGFINPSTERNCENCDVPLPIALKEAAQPGLPAFDAAQVASRESTEAKPEITESENKVSPHHVKLGIVILLICVASALLSHNRTELWTAWRAVRQGSTQSRLPASARSVVADSLPRPAPAELSGTLQSQAVLPPKEKVVDSPAPHSRKVLAVKHKSDASTAPSSDAETGDPEHGEPAVAFSSSSGGPAAAAPAGTVADASSATGATTGGELISNPKPVYPDSAKKLGIAGTVVLQFVVSRGGNVENIRLISGDKMLADAAIQAVRRWKYNPFLLNGEPVTKQLEATFDFSLQ